MRSAEIADRCNLEIKLGERYFQFYAPEGYSSDSICASCASKSLESATRAIRERMVDGELTDEVAWRVLTANSASSRN